MCIVSGASRVRQVVIQRKRLSGEDPCSQIPDEFTLDSRINLVDKGLLAALLTVSGGNPNCYPAVATLGEIIGRKPRTVQYSLRKLESLGYIRFQSDYTVATGRRIVLCWLDGCWPRPGPGFDDAEHREDEGCNELHPPQPDATDITSLHLSVASSSDSSERSESRSSSLVDSLSEIGAIDAEGAPRDEWLDARLNSLSAGRLPRHEREATVEWVAKLVCYAFDDEGSFLGHCKTIWQGIKSSLDLGAIRFAFWETYRQMTEEGLDAPGGRFRAIVERLWTNQSFDQEVADLRAQNTA